VSSFHNMRRTDVLSLTNASNGIAQHCR